MIKDRRINPEIDEGTSKLFNRIVWILIVINVILGSILIYDNFIWDINRYMSEQPYILTEVAECTSCHHECHCDEDLHADEYGLCTCEECKHDV